MDRLIAAFIVAAAAAPCAAARDCTTPPVTSSSQAVCFATAYAEKNGIAHGQGFSRKTTKGKSAWTVSFADTRPSAGGSGWQVDVDAATGTVTRFSNYKKPAR